MCSNILTGILYIWFKERQQELHCWFNQDNAVSLHRGTYINEISSLSHFGLAQNSSISITDAQHSSISITDAQHSSISITDAQHSSISITDAQHSSISIIDAQHSSISITDAQHSSSSITDAQHSSIPFTDAQHSSISITDALGILLYSTLSQWFHSQESHLHQWFGTDSRKLQSHEWKWKSFPNPLMGEHKMVIHNHGKLCTIGKCMIY